MHWANLRSSAGRRLWPGCRGQWGAAATWPGADPGLLRLLSVLSAGGLVTLLTGCLAGQVTRQFTGSYDQAISRLYELHVLRNLARCDRGEFFVQLGYSNFSTSITLTGMVSATVTFYDAPEIDDSGKAAQFDFFRQSFAPTISGSQATTLSFVASPTAGQAEVAALYQNEVLQPAEARIYQVTRSWVDAARAYCAVDSGLGCWYIVPETRREAFCAFVRQASFLGTAEPSPPGPRVGPLPPSAADTDRRKDVIPDPSVPPGSLIPPQSKPDH